MEKIIPVFCLFILTACAGPVTMSPQGNPYELMRETQLEKELSFKRIVEDQDRVFNVAFPILAANAGFCHGRTAPSIGMTAWNLETVRPEFRPTAKSVYNLQSRLAVQNIAVTSPASQAGIQSGDYIVSINQVTIPEGGNARKIAAEALRRSGYNPVEILHERNGQLYKAVIQPVTSCDYPVLLDPGSNDLNAFTDGRRIIISKGILRFAENDNELALVIAHELGHLAMRHVDKQQENAMAGAIGGLAVDGLLAAAGVNTGTQVSQMGQQLATQRFSIAFEQEADYVGMYFMERAGYDSSGVAEFWRRMAAETPKSVSARSSHPTTPERFLAIQSAHQEIAGKKYRKEEMAPNFRQR